MTDHIPTKAGKAASELETLAEKIEGNHIVMGGNGPNFSAGWSMANKVSARMVREFAALAPSPADRAASVGAAQLVGELVRAVGFQERMPSEANENAYQLARDAVMAALATPQALPTPQAAGLPTATHCPVCHAAFPCQHSLTATTAGWASTPQAERSSRP